MQLSVEDQSGVQSAGHPHQEHVSIGVEATALTTLAELAISSHVDVVVDGDRDIKAPGERSAQVQPGPLRHEVASHDATIAVDDARRRDRQVQQRPLVPARISQ